MCPRDDVKRRNFLLGLASGICGLAGVGIVRAILQYVRPGAPMEPPTRVVMGSRDRVSEGTVVMDHAAKVILVGTPTGMYALSAICPHLGCMTRYRAESRVIECACHGSAFTLEGAPLYGPSGPLHWLDVEVNPRNEIVVNTAEIVPAGSMYKGPA